MKNIRTISSLFLLTAAALQAAGQDSTTVEPILPSLLKVQEAAVQHSPLVKREVASVEQRRHEKDVNGGAWLKGITLEAASQYGSYGDQSVNKLYLGNRVGATLRISLDDLFMHSSRSDRDEAAVTVAEYNRQSLEREVRGMVAQHYVKVQTNLRLVSIAADAYHNALTIRQNAELKFRSGEMPLYDYSRILDLLTSSSMTLERTRGELRQEWTTLEEVTGVTMESLREVP